MTTKIDRNTVIKMDKWRTDDFPEREGFRCVTVYVPDDDKYVQQLAALLAKGTDYWNWIGADSERQQRAKKWLEAYLMTDWEGCMDCDGVADCIETSDAVKDALNAYMNNYANEFIPQKNPDSKQNEDLTTVWNSGCNPDILWSQCAGLVARTNDAITDWLQTLADEDTAAKIAGVIASLPLLENAGLSSLTGLAEILLTVPLLSYEADFDLSYAETLACELFCLSQGDCVITFGDFYNLIYDRVAGAIPDFVPPDNFLNIVQWAEAIAFYVIELTSINKADLMFYIMLGGVRFGEIMFGSIDDGMQLFRIATMLAADEPSNDWEALCTFCTDVWSHELDLTDTDGDFVAVSSAGLWADGQGWGVFGSPNTNSIVIQRTLPAGAYTQIRVTATAAPAYSSAVYLRTALLPGGSNIDDQTNQPGTAVTQLSGSWINPAALFINYSKTASTPLSGYTGKIITVRFTGTGTNPF